MPRNSKPLPRTIEIEVADPATEEVFPTSLLDGIMRKIYNPVTLTYSLADDADLDAIISTTCAGLQTLMRDEYRFLAASVHEDPHTGHSFAKRTRGRAQSRFTIHVNDLRHTLDFPSYAALAAAHFPVSALEDPRLLPPSFTPFPAAPADGSGIPVTLVQLNVIRGGLIIGLAINHRVVDARGLDAIVARWAAHTRALFAPSVHAPPVPPFEHAELDREPLDWAARAVERGGGGGGGGAAKVDWRDPTVPSMRCLPDGAPTGPGVKPEDMASRIWHVSASKLAALKARASVAEGGGEGGGGGGGADEGEAWVSTNDCLTALMWRCITRARLARHGIDAVSCVKDTRPVKLMNAIDVRAYVPTTPAAAVSSPSSSFDSSDDSGSGSGTEGSDTDSDTGRCSPTNGIGIPDAYPGNAVMFSHATLPLNTLLAPSFPSSSSSPDPAFRHVALAIRSAISYYRHPSTLRSALSWIASCPSRGVGTIEMDFDVVLGLDVVATSWRVLRAYERADFGWSSDGGLKALRWAAPLFDGYCFFYPTRKAGAGEDEGVEVYLGLERGCMERLVADPELAGWAEVRGE